MIRFIGCLVILDRDTHARVVAATVKARADAADHQVRALAAETEIRRLRRENRRLTVVATTLEAVNEDLRDTVRMDEALLGFGQQEDAG